MRRLGRLVGGFLARQPWRRPGCVAATGEAMDGVVLWWDHLLCDGRWSWIWRPGQICRGSALAGQRRVMWPGWGGWRSSTDFPTTPCVFMARVCSDLVSGETVVALLSMKIAPTSVMAGDDGVSDAISLLRHRRCKLRQHDRDVRGKP